VDKTARLRHMVFKIKDVPVLYFPYMVFPMERKTRNSGFLPFHTGNSTSKGRVFTMGYFQTLGRSADATVYGEYFSERGLAMGGVFRVRPSENTRLYVQAYGINDRLDQGGAQIFVDGESRMSNGFRALARVNITTNFRFRQAFADNFRLATIPLQDSVFFLTRNQGSYSTNILFQRNDVYLPGGELVVRKAPSFEFSSLGQPLGNTPLILYFRTSVDALSRRDSLIETPGIVQRLDLYPRIGIRLPSFMGFSLFPRVGVRTTYYSSRVTDSETPQIADGRLFRRYADFDLDLRAPILERSFQNTFIGSFKHTVEPVATYRWIHGISNLHETIRFDEEDAIADTSEVEYGVVNRFFRRRQVRPGVFQNHEVLSVAVLQKYFFDPDFGGAFRPGQPNIFYPLNTLTGFSLTGIQRRLAPTSLSARVSPTTTISYDVRADYDTQLQRMRDASVSALWVQSSLIVAGTYFKTHAVEQGQFESNHVQGLIGYGSPLKGLSASLLLSYNLRNSTLLNTLSRVNYMWNCCGLSVEFQQFDLGLRTESRLNFSFTLKGIGNFGNIKRPESLF